MKHLFTTIVFVLLLQSAFAQKIYFSDTTNVWRVFTNTPAQTPYSEFFTNYYYGNDTLVAGNHYRKMAIGCNDPFVYIREDTVLKKVFIKAQHIECQKVDTNEMVLYDYNMQVGSTIINNYTNQPGSPDYYSKHHVQSIDSTLIGNHYYKVWHMLGDSATLLSIPISYDIIEGIGTTMKPFYTRYPYFFEVNYRLVCFKNLGQAQPLNPAVGLFDNAVTCTIVGLKEIQQRNAASLYPNPASSTSVIELKNTIANGELCIYDILGRTIYHTAIDNEQKISVGKYLPTSGQYFFKVTDRSNSQTYTGKFIVE